MNVDPRARDLSRPPPSSPRGSTRWRTTASSITGARAGTSTLVSHRQRRRRRQRATRARSDRRRRATTSRETRAAAARSSARASRAALARPAGRAARRVPAAIRRRPCRSPRSPRLTGVGIETVKSRLRYATQSCAVGWWTGTTMRHEDERDPDDPALDARWRAHVARRAAAGARRAILAAAHRAVQSGPRDAARSRACRGAVGAARRGGDDRGRRYRRRAAGAEGERRDTRGRRGHAARAGRRRSRLPSARRRRPCTSVRLPRGLAAAPECQGRGEALRCATARCERRTPSSAAPGARAFVCRSHRHAQRGAGLRRSPPPEHPAPRRRGCAPGRARRFAAALPGRDAQHGRPCRRGRVGARPPAPARRESEAQLAAARAAPDKSTELSKSTSRGAASAGATVGAMAPAPAAAPAPAPPAAADTARAARPSPCTPRSRRPRAVDDDLRDIRRLRNEGRDADAALALAAFRAAYADADTRLPEDLRAWARSVPQP